MGEHKFNPKSEWFKKRHPQPDIKLTPKEFIENIKSKKSFTQKIKKFFCLPE